MLSDYRKQNGMEAVAIIVCVGWLMIRIGYAQMQLNLIMALYK